jgi:hypothetical protein
MKRDVVCQGKAATKYLITRSGANKAISQNREVENIGERNRQYLAKTETHYSKEFIVDMIIL